MSQSAYREKRSTGDIIWHFINQHPTSWQTSHIPHPTSQTSHITNIPHPEHPTSRISHIPIIPHREHPTSQTSHILNISHPQHPTSPTSHIPIMPLPYHISFLTCYILSERNHITRINWNKEQYFNTEISNGK